MKKMIWLALAALIVTTAGNALAWELDFPGAMTKGEFREFSRELGSAIGYRNLAPAAPLGLTGFDVAAQVSATQLKHDSGYWRAASGGAPSYAALPSLRARKGLPYGIDVGAMYTQLFDSDIRLAGLEVGKSLLDGTLATPAVGVRATYTRLLGVDELAMQTGGVDVAVSKGLLFLTPYAGAGMLWIDAKTKGSAAGIGSDSVWQPRGFAGLKLSPLPLLGLTAEIEYAARPIYSLKAGVSF